MKHGFRPQHQAAESLPFTEICMCVGPSRISKRMNKMSETNCEGGVARKDSVWDGVVAQGMCCIYIDVLPLIDGTNSVLTLPPSLIMSAPLIRCRGCDKVFTPHGHYQHTSKTRCPGCQSSQGLAAFQSIDPTWMESSLASNANPESWNMAGETGTYGDTFARTNRPFSTKIFSAQQQGHEDDVTGDYNEGTFFMTYGDASCWSMHSSQQCY